MYIVYVCYWVIVCGLNNLRFKKEFGRVEQFNFENRKSRNCKTVARKLNWLKFACHTLIVQKTILSVYFHTKSVQLQCFSFYFLYWWCKIQGIFFIFCIASVIQLSILWNQHYSWGIIINVTGQGFRG